MIAYKTQDIDNAEVREETLAACKKGCITEEEYQQIKTQYPSRLYTPHPFIRIGLFIVAVLVVLFSYGLLLLLLLDVMQHESGFGGLALFFGLLAYGALELFIREKHHYRSGVDDGLTWAAGGLLLTGFAIIGHLDPESPVFYGILFLLAAFFAARFLNMLMGLTAFAGLIGLVFFSLVNRAPDAIPFMLILLSLGVFLLARKYSHARYYGPMLQLLQAAALVMLYASGNYYAVRETTGSLHGPDAVLSQGWFFWGFTVLVPLLYIYGGIRKKDKLFLRTGLILTAAIVFTIRYYHSVMPLEAAMVVGGFVMMGLAYALIQYLATPKHGFTNDAQDEAETLKGLQIAESLVIAQTFRETPAAGDQFEFGGGSGGGGGAGGNY